MRPTKNQHKNHHMSYSTTYNQGQYARRRAGMNRNQNSVAFASAIKLGPVTHTVLVALMITVLGLIYLTQATKATSYDYEAQKIDSQISELSEERTDLEVENARLTALSTVRDSSVAKAMTKPDAPAYVSN
jgi:cell division protein FtsL